MNSKKMQKEHYDFHIGASFSAYKFMGCHKTEDSYFFRVWAPHADRIFLVGDFNSWDESCPMKKVTLLGIFEAVVDASKIRTGQKYKFKIYNGDRVIYKSDPYGIRMEEPPNAASIICDCTNYEWHDKGWISHRRAFVRSCISAQPMNIYEVHLGTWKKRADGSYMNYSEIAKELAPYVKQMGYTHVQLMPIFEHPLDASLGYQICGFFAPTRRYGGIDDLKRFVDIMHMAGIGVIMDWVPAFFPKDDYGLFEFDGQPLYEYQSYDRQQSRLSGVRYFDLGREEVQSFLISNAAYIAEQFHIDGIRVVATSSMLWLDYEKDYGRWFPNALGDNRNLEAMSFFRKLNFTMKKEHPDVIMIADEHIGWQDLTSFEGDGGLGFDMKWNNAWCYDSMRYISQEQSQRPHYHESLTYSLCYATSDRYILPLSHGEFTYPKKSLVERSCGDYWNKFAGVRALMGYMMTHPGKKLSFMGNEIAQFDSWSYKDGIEWFILDYDMHAKFQLYIADLNGFYLEHPELWQMDFDKRGFEWIDANDKERGIISFKRADAYGNKLYVMINFTSSVTEDYYLGLDEGGYYEEIFNSDAEKYGGSGVINTGARFTAHPAECDEHPYYVRLRMPPMAICVMKRIKKAVQK